ncbi:MAG: MopE-related protein, partial [Polyangiales bacterium]
MLGALLVAGCGRFGYELLPKPITTDEAGLPIDDDASVRPDAAAGEAGLPHGGGCDGGSCTEPDGDGDGTPDSADECPTDANKSRAGRCGCGISEQDTDLDGVPDCIDTCSGNDASYTPDGSCGVGYCRTNNTPSSCLMGVETMCVPGTQLTASDATCNGIDDDCDGQIDEDYVGTLRCGVGECSVLGSRTCVNGSEVSSCTAGMPSVDNDCDGKDDDCDGENDEHYVGVTRDCGVGSCATRGQDQCVEGVVVPGCVPLSGSGTPETVCNGIDDDCDGRIDEDYVVTATNCGDGVCRRAGQNTCVNGRVVNSCVAGAPTATRDTTCNGLDDDCDRQIDEDFVVTSSSCGVGYCAATGQNTCVSGAPRNSCTPRAPRTSTDDAFAPGNGVDDDCDGRIDEDVPACNTSARTFEAGQYTVTVPGNCHSLTVRLWGGGGASGQNAGISGGGGDGGPGGYATATALVSGTISLSVGSGGASGCNNGGTNAGSVNYNGGSGGTGAGANGADGVVSGGGAGANSSSGDDGGRGYYGGGGGGQGNGGLGA